MRIISGEKKGTPLLAPAGMDTRPTTDKVKEAIFDIIQFSLEGARVLDLFAGSGQMGLEALSRDAMNCTFIEKDRRAFDAVAKNIMACGFGERAKLFKRDSLAFLDTCGKGAFDIIFLDPPYGKGLLEEALEKIYLFDILSASGIIICECGQPFTEKVPLPYEVKKTYRYGKIHVATICKQVQNENSDDPGEL